jgi:hypothetical protein
MKYAEPRRINEIANQNLTSNQRVGSSSLSGRATFLNENAIFAVPNACRVPSPGPIVRVLSEFSKNLACKYIT